MERSNEDIIEQLREAVKMQNALIKSQNKAIAYWQDQAMKHWQDQVSMLLGWEVSDDTPD